MLVACIAAAMVAQTAYDASAFFPLVPGTKKTYVTKSGKTTSQEVDVVGEPVLINGVKAYPIKTSVNGVQISTTHYRVTGDTVFCVLVSPKPPFPEPYPILKIGDGKMKWTFVGPTAMFEGFAPMTLEANSTPKGKRKVLGEEREIIEVNYKITIEGIPGQSVITQKMRTVFAKGLGIIEQDDESKVNKNVTKRSMKLIEVVAPRPPSDEKAK